MEAVDVVKYVGHHRMRSGWCSSNARRQQGSIRRRKDSMVACGLQLGFGGRLQLVWVPSEVDLLEPVAQTAEEPMLQTTIAVEPCTTFSTSSQRIQTQLEPMMRGAAPMSKKLHFKWHQQGNYVADSLWGSDSYLEHLIIPSSRHDDEGGIKGSMECGSRKLLMHYSMVGLSRARINHAEAAPPTNGWMNYA